MSYAQVLEQKISDAVEANDQEALKELLKELFQETDTTARPYDAALELKPEYRAQLEESQFEGDALINWANRIARAERLVAYRLKTAFGFSGTRIVSEGDSWFQYPVLLWDVIDNISAENDLAVFSLGAAGDLVEHMAVRREYDKALRKTRSPVLLLSGGGNDLLGEGRLANILLPYQQGAAADDLINKPMLEMVSGDILNFYRQILADVQMHHPGVTVFGHGYDTPYPKANGKYFGKPFAKAGIPLALGREVIEIVVDYFADKLNELTSVFPNYRFINLKGTVGNHPNSWKDELHPEDTGFKRASAPLIKAVKDHIALLRSQGFEFLAEAPDESVAEGVDRGFEATSIAGRTIVLDPGHGGSTNLPGASWNNAIGPSGTLEKQWTLDVCQRAQALLESRGARVLMTRDDDVSISGEGRRKVARDAQADCFVSVHFNASTNHNAQGTETYVHTNTSSARSIHLMRSVQSAMVAALGHRDRNASRASDGILRGNYSVVRENRHHAGTAVCLHEVSFMDRVDEENRIKTAGYRDRIAAALADGIDAFFHGGHESATGFEAAPEQDYDDAIHESAARQGMSVPQYLGLAEAPIHPSPPVDAVTFESTAVTEVGAVDGSHLANLPDSNSFESTAAPSLLDAMYADASGVLAADDPDAGEDAFIDGSQGIDFSKFGEDPAAEQAMFREAYSGFESSGFDYAGFSAFVAGLGLRYFTATELLYMGSSNSSGTCQGRNAPPPRELWDNIANTARMVDEIRHRLGHPIRILSGYRSPAYNNCVGGEPNSLHTKFKALDWTASGGTTLQWHQFAQAVRAENPGAFMGGIGRYDSQNFVHIDTRGTKSDWIRP